MNSMSPFKIALTSVFAVCMVVGVFLFAFSKYSSSEGKADLLVWGTVPEVAFNSALKASSIARGNIIKVSYVMKDTATFDTEFVESLAEGRGPDIVLLREDLMYKHRNKLFTIPYKSYPEENFKNTFIEQGELFLSAEGVTAIPFIVDPMVMYWNRDVFSNNNISLPPQYWDQVDSMVDKVTHRDNNANIIKSAIAFGEWRNVTNAKEIISMLMLQAGTPIVSRDNKGKVTSFVNSQFDYPVLPSRSAVDFYVKFSNPTSPSYTWNRSLPSSLNFFLSGDLAIYIGFASEVFSIQQKNSNLNFNVTYVPQIRDTARRVVFGHMYGLAMVKQSQQIQGAFTAIKALVEPNSIMALEVATNLPPVRRDLLANKPIEDFRSVFYNSALISRGWIDPNPAVTTEAFRDMVESVTSGRRKVTEALNRLEEEIGSAIN